MTGGVPLVILGTDDETLADQKALLGGAPGASEGDGDFVEPTPGDLTKELRTTQKTTPALLGLIRLQENPDPDVIQTLEMYEDAHIPRARALARAAFAGAIPAEGIMILWRRAKLAFHAAAPSVMDMYLTKMELGHRCPFSERLLVEAMKGMGILQPTAPVDDEARVKELTSSEVKSMSNDDLMEQLRVEAGFSGDA